MWKKKHGLWVIDREHRKAADRPHWITIVTGVLSPLLAVVAVWVSLHSLRIANRAYVALQAGTLQFSNYGIAVQENGSSHCIVRMNLSVTITNAGNSPAYTGYFMPKYRLPPGWSEAPAWLRKNLQHAS